MGKDIEIIGKDFISELRSQLETIPFILQWMNEESKDNDDDDNYCGRWL